MKIRTDFVTNSSSSSYLTVLVKGLDGRTVNVLDFEEGHFEHVFEGLNNENGILHYSFSLGNGELCHYSVDSLEKLFGILSFSDYQRWGYDFNPLLFIPYYSYGSGALSFYDFYPILCDVLQKAVEENWYPPYQADFSAALKQIASLCSDPKELRYSQARETGKKALEVLRSVIERVFNYCIEDSRRFVNCNNVGFEGSRSWDKLQYGYGEYGELESNIDAVELIEDCEAHGSETDSVSFQMRLPYEPGKRIALFLAEYLRNKYRIKAVSEQDQIIHIQAGSTIKENDQDILKALLALGAERVDNQSLVFSEDIVVETTPEKPAVVELLSIALTECLEHDYDTLEYEILNLNRILSDGFLPHMPDICINNAMWHYKERLPISDREKRKKDKTVRIDNGQKAIHSGEYYKNKELEVAVIPEPIIAIGDKAFFGCAKMEKLILPDTIKKIGCRTFSKTSIRSVKLPASVEFIGEAAFADCKNLEEVIINGSMTELPDNIFSGCDNLRSVVIKSPLKTLGRVFQKKEALESVELPSSLNWIKTEFFIGCENLKNIVFPDTPIVVDQDAFKDCNRITLPPNAEILSPGKRCELIRSKFYESFAVINDPKEMGKYIDDLLSITEQKNLIQSCIKAGIISVDDSYGSAREKTKAMRECLYEKLCHLKNDEEVRVFFETHYSPKMIEIFIKRFVIAALLYQGVYYNAIQKIIPCSSSTIARVNRCLEYGYGGFQEVFERVLEA